MQKENQRVAISKRLLKDSTMKLLKKKHIDKISVSELCEAAQINRTTFYRHYQTPHDVLMEIELDFIKEIYETPVWAEDENDMRKHVLRMCTFVYENKEVVKLFIINNMDNDFMLLFQNIANSFLGSRSILYKGEVADEETIRLMNTFLAIGGYSLIRQWIMEGIRKTPDEIADLILGSFNRDITFV